MPPPLSQRPHPFVYGNNKIAEISQARSRFHLNLNMHLFRKHLLWICKIVVYE